jgi:flagellar motility protein MotE (MotC chaperone)
MTGVLIRLLRDLRLVPVVLIATISLFALKTLGLVLDAGYLFDSSGRDTAVITGGTSSNPPAPNPNPPASKPGSKPSGSAVKESPATPSWVVQRGFNFPGSTVSGDVTGSTGATPSAPKEEAPAAKGEGAAKKAPEPAPVSNGVTVPLDIERPISPAERAVLESLQKRRAELDARARELDVREDLLRAAEKRVGGRIDELKDLEARVSAIMQQKDEAEVARFKNVVSMYDNMKAKDAAKIFDGLDIKVLLDVAKEINPRRMSDILAQMAPENAQRLTVELAMRPAQREQAQAADLPKIQGKPNPN